MWASVCILQYMLHTYVIDLLLTYKESISMIVVRDIISGGPVHNVLKSTEIGAALQLIGLQIIN